MIKRTSMQTGFTLVELIIALAVFSLMLMVVLTGFIHIVRIHQSGVASRMTQQNARLVMDNITKEVRQASVAVVADPSQQKGRLCLAIGSGSRGYAVVGDNLMVGPLTSFSGGLCDFDDAKTAGWTQVNDDDVSVTQFKVETTPAVGTGLGTVVVTLTLAPRTSLDLLDESQTTCRPGPGSQFCAVTTLQSVAALRGGSGE